jgi:hypothetical protein
VEVVGTETVVKSRSRKVRQKQCRNDAEKQETTDHGPRTTDHVPCGRGHRRLNRCRQMRSEWQ